MEFQKCPGIAQDQKYQKPKYMNFLKKGKKSLTGTSKVNTQTDRQTDRRTFRLIESIGPEGRCFENDQIHDKKTQI